ncbi:nitroreductase family protein [Plebeiibacterium marinum]|uniref:Nitroreductase family protein n=1 Tax=Plebeiibacterium marinum TaxID=2992111 RepID=A0AAE3MHJ4_9BACT|nr:nitroreductase family protein [Plebeiobacterium marinum]MCW3807585.1 nitroreductase family protein [Plebeiobacterium marinum]
MGVVKNIFKVFGAEFIIDRVIDVWLGLKEQFQYRVVYPVVSKIPFAQNIYFIFSASFAHEMKMFLEARRQYLKSRHGKTGNLFLLRRNIHRLEKGLLMKDRRAVFALGYIGQTVDVFQACVSKVGNNDQLDWAFEVLCEYFEVTEPVPVIAKAKCVFETIDYVSHKNQQCTPYKLPASNINYYEAFKALAYQRKSIRHFDLNRIPKRDVVDEAVFLAGLAPSSCNRQPFQFRIIDDPELVKKISVLPGGTAGFAGSIAAMIVVVGQMNVSPTLADRHLMYVDGSLASMNLMLALESLGICTCPLNWPENRKKDKQVAQLLKLNTFERPIMMIAYGYAEENCLVACSVRKPLDQLRKYN